MNIFELNDTDNYLLNYTGKESIILDQLIIQDDIKKIKYQKFFHDPGNRATILCSLHNDQLKLDYIDTLDFKGKLRVLDTIKNDELLLEYYKTCTKYLCYSIVLRLQSDELKLKYLNDFDESNQLLIIRSLKSDELKLKYMSVEPFNNYILYILSSLTNHSYIIDYFKKNKDIKFRLDLIYRIEDEELRNYLIELLDDNIYKEVLKSNQKNIKQNILNNIELNVNYDIDNDITFGVELEACNKNFKEMLMLNNVLDNWIIMGDDTVTNGIEIVSSVLHFNEQDLKQLYYVCSMMKKSKCYIDQTCGGHIHFGFDYFKTIDEFKIFLNLYGNTENLLYTISNKTGDKTRSYVTDYARPINGLLSKISDLKINPNRFDNVKQYAIAISKEQTSRYYGLNMQNIGCTYKNTIEFRFPNGQIDFYEEINNIRLLCKLLEKSRVLANTQDQYLLALYRSLLKDHIDDNEKLDILLDLLFEDNNIKKIYRKRYTFNKPVIKTLVKQKRFEI